VEKDKGGCWYDVTVGKQCTVTIHANATSIRCNVLAEVLANVSFRNLNFVFIERFQLLPV
jgi:hypothetical protein